VLGGLYVAQAVPTYLFAAAIPPILREAGVSRTDIGTFSLLLLPLVLKFLWAPMVDRWRPVARAHRAGWVVATQGAIILLIAALALVTPDDVWTILWIGLAASFLLSTQDIATDGYAAKHLPEADRAVGNAIQGGAVALGVVVGGTLGLVLHAYFGWQVMVLTIAALSLLPLLAAFAMAEPPPGPAAAAPRPSLRAFLARPEARRILWIALTYRLSEGFVKAMEAPYMVDAGVPLEMIGYISGIAAATAGLAGSATAAWLILRRGVADVLTLLGGLRTLCFALFAAHAFGAVTGAWPLFGAAGFQTLIRYMEIVALYSLFMAVSSREQPGTDFTVLACAQLVVYLAGSLASGRIADAFGYGPLFAGATLLSLIGTVMTVAMLRDAVPATPPAAGRPAAPAGGAAG
jgi:PAT family beta-lactamase induction signal transducer AmpG